MEEAVFPLHIYIGYRYEKHNESKSQQNARHAPMVYRLRSYPGYETAFPA